MGLHPVLIEFILLKRIQKLKTISNPIHQLVPSKQQNKHTLN